MAAMAALGANLCKRVLAGATQRALVRPGANIRRRAEFGRPGAALWVRSGRARICFNMFHIWRRGGGFLGARRGPWGELCPGRAEFGRPLGERHWVSQIG